jgi:hypothetical protein
VNLGIRAAVHEIVCLTDDDCTVERSWVEAAWIHLSAHPESIVTGRVLPGGDGAGVASLVGLEKPRDYTGQVHDDVLFGCNMACLRSRVIALGGFDYRVELVEDNDLCFRWLRAGQQLHYDPSLLVWHHAWRTPPELERQFRGYARSQGIFYAKHLRGVEEIRAARPACRDSDLDGKILTTRAAALRRDVASNGWGRAGRAGRSTALRPFVTEAAAKATSLAQRNQSASVSTVLNRMTRIPGKARPICDALGVASRRRCCNYSG